MKKSYGNLLFKIAFPVCIIIGILLINNQSTDKNLSLNNASDFQNAVSEYRLPEGISKDWYSSVIENISAEDYKIRWQEKENTWRAYNPAQNLSFTYTDNGFIVKPLSTKVPVNSDQENNPFAKKEYRKIDDWQIILRAMGCGKDGSFASFSGSKLTAEKNKAYIEDDHLKIEYLNDRNGMRQDFTVKNKPAGSTHLRVALAIETKLSVKVSRDEISFSNTSEEKMKYNELKVTDASGKKLIAWFENNAENNKYADIVVNDKNAEYPILIDPISTTPAWKVESNKAGAGMGASVASAGDVNRDGYDDVIVGAPVYTVSSFQEGAAFVYLGSPSGPSTTPIWTKGAGQGVAQYGGSVACAGDVNNDGYSDIIVGAPNYHNTDDNEGAAFVYYGSSSGPSTTANWVVEGNMADAWFGTSVACAGDVNGDGIDDVVVGAFAWDNPSADEGKAFVYYGSASGLSTTPAWTAEGNLTEAFFGCSAASAGDVNNDGYDDIIVGAYKHANPDFDEGKAYLYYGSPTGPSLTPNWEVEGNQTGAWLGASVAGAGDINHDGFSDVIISAYSWDEGQANISKVMVYHGSSSGLPAAPNWTQLGSQTQSQFGYCVASAGNVNGDQYSDIIIGARLFDNGQTDEGAAFVYYGSPNGIITPYSWRGEANLANAFMGRSVASAGDVNGDGFDDIIVGAAGYTSGQSNEGAAYVYFGVNDPWPVELISFRAEVVNGQVSLNWKTATEVNNYGFEIERKNSAGLPARQESRIQNPEWENIGFVKGYGNSNSPKEYSFTDKNAKPGKYIYRLKQIDNDGTSAFSDEVKADLKNALTEYSLLHNYPNPFNPFTKISYTILNDSKVKLTVYNMVGREIAVLVNGHLPAGNYEAAWNAGNISSGIYLYTLESVSVDGKTKFKSVKKMVYMK